MPLLGIDCKGISQRTKAVDMEVFTELFAAVAKTRSCPNAKVKKHDETLPLWEVCSH